MLGDVRVNAKAPRLGGFGDLAPELLAAAQDEARRKRILKTPTGALMPAFCQRDGVAEARAGAFAQSLRHAFAEVHHGLAGDAADSRAFHRAKDRVLMMHGPHVEDRRGPSEHHLGEAKLRGGFERRHVVGGFKRPDSFLEPRQERQVVRHVAKERLAQMNVSLNKPRQHKHALGVDLLGPAWRDEARSTGSAQRSDSPVPDEDVALEHAPGPVHRDEGPALDQQCLLNHSKP